VLAESLRDATLISLGGSEGVLPRFEGHPCP
jgi:hypothetical protein